MTPDEQRHHRRLDGITVILFVAVLMVAAVAVTAALTALGEGHTREAQFCRLTLSAHDDKVKRLRNTMEYLDTPVGHEPTGLNTYIRRISLPQLTAEVAGERKQLPKVCLAYR